MSGLSALSYGELAEHLREHPRARSGGVAFAQERERPNKDVARADVLRAFSPRYFVKGLSILTMPGLYWTFERELLQMREANRMRRRRAPGRTFIASLESDEAIYRASFKFMPGKEGDARGHGIAVLPAYPGATTTVRTPMIQRYHRCTFEDYVDNMQPSEHFDGAWLDFTGQLTERRVSSIQRFWINHCRSCLVVTGLNGRTSAEITEEVKRAGTMTRYLDRQLPGARCVNAISYRDTTRMFQATFIRPHSATR